MALLSWILICLLLLFPRIMKAFILLYENLVNDLTQDKLDYLASIQWKDDLSFDGKGQNIASTEKSSLTEYFRDLKVNISSDKENTQFLNTTQKNVKIL